LPREIGISRGVTDSISIKDDGDGREYSAAIEYRGTEHGHDFYWITDYFRHYHQHRTHRSLDEDCPEPRPVELPDQVNIIACPWSVASITVTPAKRPPEKPFTQDNFTPPAPSEGIDRSDSIAPAQSLWSLSRPATPHISI